MKTEYVVIDTETTGFDAKNCAIIEIAAVKWDKGLIKEGFTSLINPGQPIPEEISDITGITDEMVKEQPLIQDVIPRLEKFIGDAVLVAHNAPFDKSFMDNVWSLENQWLDSITLAQIVFPTAGTYSLGFLCQYLGIENTDAHRSLSDTKATAELFGRSLQELAALSWPIKRELLEMVKDDESALGRLIYRECKKDPQVDEKEPWDSVVLTAKPATKESVPRQRVVNEEYLLNLKEIEKYLTSDELCGQHIADFEPRQQQLEMSQAVAEAFNLQNFLLAEAGTGTGKSLAYLLPAALFALHSGQPVVISTHTINLQEQLIKKDIPQLKAILKEEFKAAVIKGRSHYLCLNLLKHYVLHGDDELRYFIMRLLVWASQTSTGDSGELGLNRFERWKWQRLSASRENCVAPNCSYCRAGCFVFQSRRKAETADIIIVNHSLLVANAGLETAILPDFSYLIIDEAHHLQRDAEEQLTGVVDFYELIKGLGRLKKKERGKTVGILTQMEKQAQSIFVNHQEREQFLICLNQAEEKVGAVVAAGEEFFSLLQEIFLARAEVKAYFPSRLLIDKKDRTEEIWQQIETVGDNFKVSINLLSQTLFSLLEQVTLLSLQDGEDMFGVDQIKGLASNFLTIADLAETWLKPPDNDYVTWLTFTAGDKKPSLHMAPIDMGELLYDTLLFNKKSIVFTSATLSVANSFAYFKKNIGLDLLPEPPIELLVSSPFYYNEQALFAICTDLPDWTKQSEVQCIEAIGSTLIKLIESSEGRALILFTSHAQLKAVYRRINKPLSQKGLTVLAHGINGNPSQLLNRLKEEENCCLLGASSFWEGIDVVGSALSLVAVVRLPFWPPTDPLMYSRMKKLEDEGYNSFNAYSLPQAVIRFKQGFGRLIRSGYDKGVFCVLDRRLVEKYYGRTFVESLPEMQIVCDTHEEIAEHVRQWLK